MKDIDNVELKIGDWVEIKVKDPRKSIAYAKVVKKLEKDLYIINPVYTPYNHTIGSYYKPSIQDELLPMIKLLWEKYEMRKLQPEELV